MISPGWDVSPFAKRVPVSPGTRGTLETLGLEGQLAAGALLDPNFALYFRRKLLIEPATDPRDIRAVFGNAFRYVQTNVGYQPDPLVYGEDSAYDWVQSPHWTFFLEGLGDCLAHAGALGAVSMSLGHGFAFRTLRADPRDPDRFSHVYALLGYPSPAGDVWIPADTTLPDGALGDELPGIERYSPMDIVIAPAS